VFFFLFSVFGKGKSAKLSPRPSTQNPNSPGKRRLFHLVHIVDVVTRHEESLQPIGVHVQKSVANGKNSLFGEHFVCVCVLGVCV